MNDAFETRMNPAVEIKNASRYRYKAKLQPHRAARISYAMGKWRYFLKFMQLLNRIFLIILLNRLDNSIHARKAQRCKGMEDLTMR